VEVTVEEEEELAGSQSQAAVEEALPGTQSQTAAAVEEALPGTQSQTAAAVEEALLGTQSQTPAVEEAALIRHECDLKWCITFHCTSLLCMLKSIYLTTNLEPWSPRFGPPLRPHPRIGSSLLPLQLPPFSPAAHPSLRLLHEKVHQIFSHHWLVASEKVHSVLCHYS
jgi:hypothetical protein